MGNWSNLSYVDLLIELTYRVKILVSNRVISPHFELRLHVNTKRSKKTCDFVFPPVLTASLCVSGAKQMSKSRTQRNPNTHTHTEETESGRGECKRKDEKNNYNQRLKTGTKLSHKTDYAVQGVVKGRYPRWEGAGIHKQVHLRTLAWLREWPFSFLLIIHWVFYSQWSIFLYLLTKTKEEKLSVQIMMRGIYCVELNG